MTTEPHPQNGTNGNGTTSGESGGESSPQQQRLYASNPNKRRRIRVIPLWLEKHARPIGSDPPVPNSVDDPEALEELIDYVVQGNVVAVKLLAEAGVNLNMEDSDGRTPLHHAMSNGQDEVEELLIEKGAESKTMSIENSKGMIPLTQENE